MRTEAMTISKKQRPHHKPRLGKQHLTHSEDGVDLTLIRWMLSLTPEQRLKALEDNVCALTRLKNGTIST
jgi:hypothetical protein